MSSSLQIEPIKNIPLIKPGDNLAQIILRAIRKNNQQLSDGDIICVASKIVSVAEDRFVDLNTVEVSEQAKALHQKIPHKNPRALQLILDQTNNDKQALRFNGTWLGAITNIGRVLTSGGIDMVDEDTAILLPDNPDASAKQIGEALGTSGKVGVLITDSDGREGIAGATQICIGLYGVPPIRKQNDAEETACDMLAAAAGLVMGQRGNNIPAVIIRGYNYEFNADVNLGVAY